MKPTSYFCHLHLRGSAVWVAAIAAGKSLLLLTKRGEGKPAKEDDGIPRTVTS